MAKINTQTGESGFPDKLLTQAGFAAPISLTESDSGSTVFPAGPRVLEEDVGSDHNVLTARRIVGYGWVYAHRVERPARDRAKKEQDTKEQSWVSR